MNIVFDTNVFIANILFTGNLFNFVINTCNKIGYNLFLPRICYDELLKDYSDKIDSIHNTIAKENEKLSKLMWNKWLTPTTNINTLEYKNQYKTTIDQILQDNKISILDYPKINITETIERAVSKKKPFSEKGNGFKDYIIWQNVLYLCKKGKKKVIFISQNSKDFGVKDLFDDLKIDAENYKIELFNNLDDFKNMYIIPKITSYITLKDYFLGANANKISIKELVLEKMQIKEFVNDLLNSNPNGQFSYDINSFKPLNDIEIDDIVKLTTTNYLVFLTIKFNIEYSMKLINMSEEFLDCDIRETNAHDCLIIQGSISINKKTMQLSSYEINKIDSANLLGFHRNEHPWGIFNSKNRLIYS